MTLVNYGLHDYFYYYINVTHPVNFLSGRKPEYPGKTHNFGRALTHSFHLTSRGGKIFYYLGPQDYKGSLKNVL
jgi:hypothetical protein